MLLLELKITRNARPSPLSTVLAGKKWQNKLLRKSDYKRQIKRKISFRILAWNRNDRQTYTYYLRKAHNGGLFQEEWYLKARFFHLLWKIILTYFLSL